MTSAVGAVGASLAVVPFIASWNPSAKAKAVGGPSKGRCFKDADWAKNTGFMEKAAGFCYSSQQRSSRGSFTGRIETR